MKMKIALAALACSGIVLALFPNGAAAAPLSGLSQSHSVAMADNPLLLKVHRWWRRGWGWGSYYGYGYYRPYYYRPYYPAYYYRPYYPAYRPYYYYALPPPPPYYYYRPYWGPYY